MSSVFIAGTDTGVGKTHVTVGLLRALGARGMRACGMKPVATGVSDAADIDHIPHIVRDFGDDGRVIAAEAPVDPTTGSRPPLALINPVRLPWAVSPHIAAAAARTGIDLDVVAAAYQRLAATHAVVVVEGTGGWYAPIDAQRTMADIARRLSLPVVLVVGMRLGCLNHALLSAQAIAHDGLRLCGWIANEIDPAMEALEQNVATLSQRLAAPLWARLPFSADERSGVSRLDDLARYLAEAAV